MMTCEDVEWLRRGGEATNRCWDGGLESRKEEASAQLKPCDHGFLVSQTTSDSWARANKRESSRRKSLVTTA